jgi:hypothetical protein
VTWWRKAGLQLGGLRFFKAFGWIGHDKITTGATHLALFFSHVNQATAGFLPRKLAQVAPGQILAGDYASAPGCWLACLPTLFCGPGLE